MAATTIQVSERTADELAELKGRGDTYDDVIRRLLELEASAAATAGGGEAPAGGKPSKDGAEEIKCQHCGNVWTTSSGSQRPTCPGCTRKTDRLAPEA